MKKRQRKKNQKNRIKRRTSIFINACMIAATEAVKFERALIKVANGATIQGGIVFENQDFAGETVTVDEVTPIPDHTMDTLKYQIENTNKIEVVIRNGNIRRD